MGTSKTIRDAAALLEPYGFRLEGVNGNNHYVFRDPETGAVARVGTAALTTRNAKNFVAEAQRAKRHAQSVSHRWVAWLLDRYDIADTEEKQVTIPISRLGEQFLAENPNIRGTSRGLWRIALQNSKQATLIESGKQGVVGAASVWKLRGPLFGVEPVPAESNGTVGVTTVYEGQQAEDPAAITEARASRLRAQAEPSTTQTIDEGEAREPAVSEPRAELRAGDDAADPELVGEGSGRGGPEGAAAGTEDVGAAERGDDEARVVGTRSRTSRPPGPVIPDDLAAMLSEHFSDDLRAENELLRSALDQALDALQGATQTIHAALSLRGGGDRERRYGMGPKNVRRWELMQEHRDTELAGPLTAEKLEHFFNEHGEPMANRAVAGNVLWTLHRNGLIRRGDAAGVYLWP